MKKNMQAILVKLGAILASVAAFLAVVVGVYHGSQVLTPPVDNSLAGVAGNEVQGPEWIVGGAKMFYVKQAMNFGTSTVCIMNAPRASSTLIRAEYKLNTSATLPTQSGYFGIYKSVAPTYATSTFQFGGRSITAPTSSIGAATTTITNATDATANWNFDGGPNDKLIFDYQGTTTFQGAGGTCTGVWQVL